LRKRTGNKVGQLSGCPAHSKGLWSEDREYKLVVWLEVLSVEIDPEFFLIFEMILGIITLQTTEMIQTRSCLKR
jgi:hypothetical protein